jgi:cytochrome P450
VSSSGCSAAEERAVDYSPFSPEAHADPYPLYRELRREAPLYRNERLDFWAVSRYDDVVGVLRDWKTFSSASGVDMDDTGGEFGSGNFLEEDPPLHDLLRGVVRTEFVPKHLRAALGPFVRAEVEGIVADLKRRPAVDFARELAWELPIRVVSELMGFPREDRELLRRLEESFALRIPTLECLPPFATAAGESLRRYFADLVEQRAADPRDDLLSKIVSAEIDGEPIGRQAHGLIFILFVAAIETTASLVTQSLRLLATHPEQREWLREHPEAIPQAVEEVLRYEAPVQHTKRTALRDTELLGEPIPEGSTVLVLTGSANRDERRFEEPDAFDVRREPKRHMAFGEGIHHCIGAPLARLEGEVVIETVLAELPEYRLVGEPIRLPNHIVRGYLSLPAATA